MHDSITPEVRREWIRDVDDCFTGKIAGAADRIDLLVWCGVTAIIVSAGSAISINGMARTPEPIRMATLGYDRSPWTGC